MSLSDVAICPGPRHDARLLPEGSGDGVRRETMLFPCMSATGVPASRGAYGSALRRMKGSIMNRKPRLRLGVLLASLLMLLGSSLGSVAHAVAPTVTIAGLRVNGVNVACGATVHTGDTVCVRFSSDQTASAQVTVVKGTTTSPVASGTASAGVNYLSCVTAGTADSIVRTFTVKVTNANGTDTKTCAYTVVP